MIRPATAEDLPRVVEISHASFGPITWQRTVDQLFGPLKGHDWRDRWLLRIERAVREQIFLVLEEGGLVCGYACGIVDPVIGLGHLDLLAVDPSTQGRGYGRQLLHAIQEVFLSRGATHITLESLHDNEVANGLYETAGFRQVACHWNWFKKIDLAPNAGVPGASGA